MSETPEPAIYQLKVLLLGISPMIWRRLLVCSTTTITDFHHILQISMGWSDDHLHMFRIHGKQYGIARIGGLSFSNDPDTIRLNDFRFRINETFLYEGERKKPGEVCSFFRDFVHLSSMRIGDRAFRF
jgi:hypothetical protein